MIYPWLVLRDELDSFGNFLLPGRLFNKFLLESLILAQDERWRRA